MKNFSPLKKIMDENHPFCILNKILPSRNRTNSAVKVNINFKIVICSTFRMFDRHRSRFGNVFSPLFVLSLNLRKINFSKS